MKKILIVEDEKQLSQVMCLYLSKEGYECITAFNGNDGEKLLNENTFDLIILDIMMPGKDGWSLLRKIKSQGDTPVIITTARSEEDDRVFGLELGADDYMTKPLSMRELVLRVKLRISSVISSKENVKNDFISIGSLKINEQTHVVTIDNETITLTPKEYTLLVFLCRNINIVFSRDKLLNEVWGYDFYGDTRTVDTHIKKLREKVSLCKSNLKTIWKIGYKFEWSETDE
ncbi:response regulator transcription factor [Oceanirhabdus sp. W0125-5]|uniref:response regulator transcription factor n=1 Tax=Oceanirhabdus sp. W0125-5 TaxID=2999116 RepID=UPI0022F31B25|nr:response regulator transcription factor [Oceanirhabdus sp. W0125-5]WBW96539.1 response regulator transcription factor [Oceanirhabdus sp. W0125-5]